MQELIDKLEYLQRTNPNKLFIEQGIHHGLEAAIKEAKSMLEKEKEQRMEAWCKGYDSCDEDISGDSPLEYYNKAFKTK